MKGLRWVGMWVVLVVLLAGCAPVAPAPAPEPPAPVVRAVSSAGIDTPVSSVWYNAAGLTVYSDDHATSKFSVNGSTGATATGALTVTGAATVSGALTVSGLLLGNSTQVTLTTGTLTPAYNNYLIDAAAAITLTMATTCATGHLLTLAGNDAQTITIADTRLKSSDGNALTIGQYDVVALLCVGNEWWEIAKSANS